MIMRCRARRSKKENFFHVKGYGIKIYPQTNIMFTSKMRREQLENKQMTYEIVKARELHLVYILEINNHVYMNTSQVCKFHEMLPRIYISILSYNLYAWEKHSVVLS